MNFTRMPQLGPIARISLGLIVLLLSLGMLANVLTGGVPGPDDIAHKVRMRTAENLAVQLAALLELGDEKGLVKTARLLLGRNTDVRGITLRRSDGTVALQEGEAFASATSAAAPPELLRISLRSETARWGDVEVRFDPLPALHWRGVLTHPATHMLALMALGGFLLSFAYLSRAMQYLNPSQAVPDRVRKAFDSLSEGLLIIDRHARIVLANRAFRQLHPDARGELNGRRIETLQWLGAQHGDDADEPRPWMRTLRDASSVSAEPLCITPPDGPPLQLLVSCSPIGDGAGRTRGCLITFDDVTAVHGTNAELRATLAELERSRELIEEQNVELRRLASRDPLTGCFNRRAFFEMAGALFDAAHRNAGRFCCLMADIDHFKQFNDLYGHAVGDQVIQVVSRALGGGLRQVDLLCRYGGEEFCIVLPGATREAAQAIAERIRADIEAHASAGVRGTDVRRITSSFGLATLDGGASTLPELIDQADQALYAAKQAGRNRVMTWTPAERAAEVSAAPREPATADARS